MIKIWGHRGCRGKNNPPENSLAAFREAIRQGADGIELDVFLTRDNKLVVFHDDTLERMTGVHGKISDWTLDELKTLRLMGPDDKPTREPIPTLEEVLKAVDQFRHEHPKRGEHFTVNIEIKPMVGKNIAEPIADVVDRRMKAGWTKNNVQVSSFDMESLRALRKAKPEIPIGMLLEAPRRGWRANELQQRIEQASDIQPATINIPLSSMTRETAAVIRKSGAKPVAWTASERDPGTMRNGMGAALAEQIRESQPVAVITDYPKEMKGLLDSPRMPGGNGGPAATRARAGILQRFWLR